MTNHRDNEYPGNWHAGIGEANRPLNEGGYYLHAYYRVLPGSNQHVERFLELRVDTSGLPPDQHCLELNYSTEDGESVTREKRRRTFQVDVTDPGDPDEQADAEEQAHKLAVEWMEAYADWTP